MAMTPSRGRLSTGTATSSLVMAASDDDAMEEASVFTLSSPPRSASKSSSATALFQEQTTPKSSRRLFREDDDDEDGFFIPTRAPALTPYNANPRRARLARPMQRQDSIESEGLTGRKRSSDERRDSYEGDTSMHMSPHISPNSYVTMDGRFVQSKNPFSSPMVTEDDSHHMQVLAGAPSLPSFSFFHLLFQLSYEVIISYLEAVLTIIVSVVKSVFQLVVRLAFAIYEFHVILQHSTVC